MDSLVRCSILGVRLFLYFLMRHVRNMWLLVMVMALSMDTVLPSALARTVIRMLNLLVTARVALTSAGAVLALLRIPKLYMRLLTVLCREVLWEVDLWFSRLMPMGQWLTVARVWLSIYCELRLIF